MDKIFQSKNLQIAREFAGVSKTILAEYCDISLQSISYYESGERIPREDIIHKLSQKLGQPFSYFFTNFDNFYNEKSSPIFFRKYDNKTLLDRKKSIAMIVLFSNLLSKVNNYFDFPDVSNIPSDFYIDNENLNDPDYDIEDVAQKTREYFGLKPAPISNMHLLLENNLIPIVYSSSIGEDMNAFSLYYTSIFNIHTKIASIFINKSKHHSISRIRFTLAHELGHLVMHRNLSSDYYHDKDNYKLVEKQADRFAGAFLLPREAFLNDIRKVTIGALAELKKRWKVSIQAMIYRLFELEVIDEDKKINLMKEMSFKGYRKKEPYDDEIMDEFPTFMNKAIEKMPSYLRKVDINKKLATELTNYDFCKEENDKLTEKFNIFLNPIK